MTKIVSLEQGALDDAFHEAIFLCDAAIEPQIRAAFFQCEMLLSDVDKQVLARFIDNIKYRLEQEFHHIETKHLGEERYAAMMERILAKRNQPKAPQ